MEALPRRPERHHHHRVLRSEAEELRDDRDEVGRRAGGERGLRSAHADSRSDAVPCVRPLLSRLGSVGRGREPVDVNRRPYDARVRAEPTILHVDLDAFFAAVEQRDKPSLRGKPVVVGGVGGRGVVATASYEARAFGVHSAMSDRRGTAALPERGLPRRPVPRLPTRPAAAVMELLRGLSPLVEPLSLDEAFVDLAEAALPDHSVATVSAFARELKDRVREVTGGLTGSVGVGTSKLIAKIASDLDKPDGLVVVAPGNERDLLRPMQVTVIPGVGPATAEHLRRHRRAHRRRARAGQRGRAGPGARQGPRPQSPPAGAGRGRPAGGRRSARPSRSASRTPTRPTTSTDGCSRHSWTDRRPRSPNGCGGRGSRAAP